MKHGLAVIVLILGFGLMYIGYTTSDDRKARKEYTVLGAVLLVIFLPLIAVL